MVGDPRPRLTAFTSRLHSPAVAGWLGIALGVAFTLAFLTGLASHLFQHQPSWLALPTRPPWFYRVSQGVHVVAGIASVPLLLAKLWTVYPKLFAWPPFRSLGHALERGFVLLLVVTALFQLSTGIVNGASWYPFGFDFTSTHYAVSWVLVGTLVVHVAHKWRTAREAISGPMSDPSDGALSRRQFLATVGAASGLVVLVSAGQTVPWLRPLGLLANRRGDLGPQGLPVNRTAAAAGVTESAHDPAYRLRVTGAVRRELSLSLAELRRLPRQTAELPIACVEGWSAGATWTGVRLRDLLDAAGAVPGARVRVESLQRGGRYRESYVDAPRVRDPLTLLALDVNGEPLADDHGFPCRLIAPNRPGVLQTKWVTHVEVLR